MARTKTTDTDKLVAARIRELRRVRGLTINDIAKAVGISYQQVQKFEVARDRISCGRIAELAKLLGVPVSYFFDEQDRPAEKLDRLTLNHVREFNRLSDPVRKAVAEMVRTVAEAV